MKTLMKVLFSLALLAMATPVLTAGQKLDRADIKLWVPDNWVVAPHIVEAAIKGAGGSDSEVETSALGYASPMQLPVVLGLFVRSKQSVGEDLRQELLDFHSGMRKAMEKDGATFTAFEITETPTRMTSSFTMRQGQITMIGKAVAAVRSDGRLLGWSVECIWATDQSQDAEVCAQVLASFEVVHPDSDLRRMKK